MNSKIKEILEKLATREEWNDAPDFNPYDFSGGNYDDAYWGGYEDGKASLAKELLGMFEEG